MTRVLYAPILLAVLTAYSFGAQLDIDTPNVELHISTQSPPIGLPVDFDADVTPKTANGINYRFRFGDEHLPATWSQHSTTNHTYSKAGLYMAVVEIARSQDPTKKVISISRLEVRVVAPVYTLTIKPDRADIEAGHQVEFSAAVTPPATGFIYVFDFGDGEKSPSGNSSTAVHKYTQARTVPYAAHVLARYSNGDGSTNGIESHNAQITVRAGSPVKPPVVPTLIPSLDPTRQPTVNQATVSLDVDPPVAEVGQSVRLAAHYSNSGKESGFRFEFDDGTPSKLAMTSRVEHKYARPGTYHPHAEAGRLVRTAGSVSLMAAVTSSPQEVDVSLPTLIRLLPNKVQTRTGRAIAFTVVLKGGTPQSEIEFDPGDGSKARAVNGARISFRYAHAGNYIARASVTSGASRGEATAVVEVSYFPPTWLIAVFGLAAALGTGWALRIIFAPKVTFHPHLDDEPKIHSGTSQMAPLYSIRLNRGLSGITVAIKTTAPDNIITKKVKHV